MTETIIHEEHHEAFLMWHQAISNGLIYKKANTLIHVDSHDDFGCPFADQDINKLSEDLEEIENYTYWQLNIANFIVPALYKKIFDKLIWITPDHKKEPQTKQYSIRTIKEEGKHFVMGSYNQFHSVNFPWHDSVQFQYVNANTEHPITSAMNVVLDIDLDYFSCIEKRMENFRDCLIKNKIKPSFINVCRSVKSGYTPKDQAVFIEEKLLEMLEQLYSISIRYWQPSA